MRLFSPTWPNPGRVILDNPAADPEALERLADQLASAGLAPRDYHLRSFAAQVRTHAKLSSFAPVLEQKDPIGGPPLYPPTGTGLEFFGLQPSTGSLQPSTGTIFGKHSLGETRDLLAHTNFRFDQTEKALQALIQRSVEERRQGRPINEAALGAIGNDWGALLPKWKSDSRRFAQRLVSIARYFPLNSPATIATEDVWKELVLYLRPEPNDFAKGTLPDIMRRIEAMGQPIDLSNEPREDARDFDYEVLGDVTAVTRQLEAAHAAVKQGTKSTLEEYWPVIALAGFFGLLTASILYAPEIKAVLRSKR